MCPAVDAISSVEAVIVTICPAPDFRQMRMKQNATNHIARMANPGANTLPPIAARTANTAITNPCASRNPTNPARDSERCGKTSTDTVPLGAEWVIGSAFLTA